MFETGCCGLGGGAPVRRADGLKRALRVVCLGALAMALSACSSTARTLEAATVRLQGLALVQADADEQAFAVRLRVDNPNASPMPVTGVEFRVRLGGDGLLTGSSSESLTVPPQGSETLVVEVDTDMVSSLSRLTALLQGPAGALGYELFGELSLGRPFRSPQPFSARGEVPLSMSAGGL